MAERLEDAAPDLLRGVEPCNMIRDEALRRAGVCVRPEDQELVQSSVSAFRHQQGDTMSAFETIKAAYAAFDRNDPSVLFAAMDPAINWNEAEGTSLAGRNPYVGPQAVAEGVFGHLLAAIDNFTVRPDTIIDGGDHVVALGRYRGTMKDGGATLDAPFCHVYRFHGDKVIRFQQFTDTSQWARLMP